eukprot:366420-Chlamydomonas_euryale.AAC.6
MGRCSRCWAISCGRSGVRGATQRSLNPKPYASRGSGCSGGSGGAGGGGSKKAGAGMRHKRRESGGAPQRPGCIMRAGGGAGPLNPLFECLFVCLAPSPSTSLRTL